MLGLLFFGFGVMVLGLVLMAGFGRSFVSTSFRAMLSNSTCKLIPSHLVGMSRQLAVKSSKTKLQSQPPKPVKLSFLSLDLHCS